MIVKQKIISLSVPSFGRTEVTSYAIARTAEKPVDRGRAKIVINEVTPYVKLIGEADKGPHEFNIPYEFYGDKGPVMVLIGGFQQTSDAWKRYIADLSKDHRVVLLTLPGVGDESQPNAGIIEHGSSAVTLKEYAFVVDQIIQKRFDFAKNPENGETFKAEDLKVNMWSMSFGSLVAQTLCSRYEEFNSDRNPGRHKYSVDKVVLESMPLGFNENLVGILERGARGEATYEDILGFGQNLSSVMKRIIKRQFTDMSKKTVENIGHYNGYLEHLHKEGSLYDKLGVGKANVGSYYMVLGKHDRIVDTDEESLINYFKLLSGSDGEPIKNKEDDRVSFAQGNVRVTSFFNQAHFGHIEENAEDLTESIYDYFQTTKAKSENAQVITVDFKTRDYSSSSSTTGTENYIQTQTEFLEFRQAGQ